MQALVSQGGEMQMTIRKYKNIAVVGFMALAVAIALIYAWPNLKDVETGVTSNNRDSASTKASGEAGLKMLPQDKESRRQRVEQGVKSNAQAFSTMAEAANALSFKPKYPKLESLGQPTGIYVDKGENKEDRTVLIYYGDPVDGILVQAKKFRPINFQE